MKLYLALFLLANFSGLLHAQTIRTLDHQPVKLPNQFVVSPAGIEYLREGMKATTTAPWDKIDLAALAKEEPTIEAARKQVILTNQSVYLQVPPPHNYYLDFLNLPVNVRFPSTTQIQSQTSSTYYESTTGFSSTDGSNTSYAFDGLVTGESSTKTKIIDTTRYPLCTTIEGLLRTIGNDYNPDSKKLIIDLQKNATFFPDLVLGLEDLATIYPKDPDIQSAIAAVGSFTTGNKAISVDAQRTLASFAVHCHQVKP